MLKFLTYYCLGLCTAFTKDLRIFEVDFDYSNSSILHFQFDRAVTPLVRSSELLCIKVNCRDPSNATSVSTAVKNLIELQTATTLADVLASYYNRATLFPENEWFGISDNTTRRHWLESGREVESLRQGSVNPRQGCLSDHPDNTNRSRKGCLLSEVFPESDLIGGSRLRSLDNWITAAELLFNGEFYDHAEALVYFILRQVKSSKLDLSGEDSYIRALIILTEVSKEKGHLRESVHFALQVIDSYSLVSPVKSAIHRLRLLLTVPPIPAQGYLAIAGRMQILADLRDLLADIKQDSLVLSVKELFSDVSSTPFHIAHQGLNDLAIQTALSNLYAALCPGLLYLSPLVGLHNPRNDEIEIIKSTINVFHTLAQAVVASPPVPIRIGFVSTHFYEHSIGRMLVEMFVLMHEKGQLSGSVEVVVLFIDERIVLSSVELGVYGAGAPYTPTAAHKHTYKQDFITTILSDRMGKDFRRLPAFLPLLQAEIAGENLDFLMFTDLGMDFLTYALAHSRLAKYQAAWWGHPITSGLPSVDFYFGLDIESPLAGPQHYSEQLVRMTTMNSAPIRPIDHPSSFDRGAVLESMSIARGSELCVVLGRLFKLHPDFDESLAGVLLGSPSNAVLVLVGERIAEWNQVIYDRLLAKLTAILLQSAGVDGDSVQDGTGSQASDTVLSAVRVHAFAVMGKLRIVSYDHYTDLLLLASVVLDTYPYGGCLTSHDALSNSVPVVTLPLEHVRGRYTLGMYVQMGMSDLIAHSPEEYVVLAVRLLSDQRFHSEQRSKILKHYTHDLHRNSMVADEWLGFVGRLLSV